MSAFQIRPIQKDDYDWMVGLLRENWGSEEQACRGKVIDASAVPGFVATQGKERIGLITYRFENNECEIVAMNSTIEEIGIGSGLIRVVKEAATSAGCRRLWLITTNDNVEMLRFCQKRGFVLVTVYRDALKQARELKPEIPLVGKHGIPLRDEIELEIILRG